MNNVALITGASNGIGLELAKIHASKGGDLVLIARSKSKLMTLKTEIENQYQVAVYIIVKDLSVVNAAQEVYDEVYSQNISVEYLINNAGLGDYGLFEKTNWDKEVQMIHLNIIALTQLAKLFLKDMIKRESGKIMNLASTAAFQPGPLMAVYFATKSYVLSFSEALNNEVKDQGITVTALCPGPTETGFQSAAAMEDSALFKERKLPTAKQVAIYGYQAMLKGKAVAIHGLMNYVMANAVRFIPRKWVVKITRKIQDNS